jgi:cyclic beta-1,2-glucan synthetase
VLDWTLGQIEGLLLKDSGSTWAEHLAVLKLSTLGRLQQTAIEFVFVPFEAYNNTHAMVTAFARLYITNSHLLEWNASASDVKYFSTMPLLKMWRAMWLVPTVSIVVLSMIMQNWLNLSEWCPMSSMNGLLASLLVVAWTASPFIGHWLSKPLEDSFFYPEKLEHLSEAETVFLRRVARKTWRYFEAFVREEDNHLPLDHY